MKTLFFECTMGAAGDMLMAALLELHPNPSDFVMRFNELKIPNITLTANKAEKCGIIGTHICVFVGDESEDGKKEDVYYNEHTHEHCHNHTHEHIHSHTHEHYHVGITQIEEIINSLNLRDKVKQNAVAIYKIIAEAESMVHGCEVTKIHFHEVGTMDAVADVVGCCMLLDELKPQKILASPIHVGSGIVKCAHGILPVPAPATAEILRGVPIYGGQIKSELCTPTGAAILKYFVEDFSKMPTMKIEKIGYGLGMKDFETANCVRAFFGETEDEKESITELCCNLDDMTGEEIGFCVDCLLESGAADVFTTPVNMKKNRPGVLLTCMCRENQREEMIGLIFKHTTTIGVREYSPNRYTLTRKQVQIQTNHGPVSAKISEGYGVKRIKPEYEDLAKIAREKGISLAQIEAEK